MLTSLQNNTDRLVNLCISHHKVVMVLSASITSESEVSMFTLIHSSTNQKLFEKYLCNTEF